MSIVGGMNLRIKRFFVNDRFTEVHMTNKEKTSDLTGFPYLPACSGLLRCLYHKGQITAAEEQLVCGYCPSSDLLMLSYSYLGAAVSHTQHCLD